MVLVFRPGKQPLRWSELSVFFRYFCVVLYYWGSAYGVHFVGEWLDILWCSVCLSLSFVTFFVKKYFFSTYQL